MVVEKIPIRVNDLTPGGIPLAEFQLGEVVSITHGGTGASALLDFALALSATVNTLSSLMDVSIPSPAANNLLAYNGTVWVASSYNQTVPFLSSLPDTSIVSPVSGKSLVYNGTVWVASTVSAAGGAGATALSGLTDTSITSPIAAQVLTWNGSIWVASTSPAGVTNHSLLTNLSANDHPQYVLSATNLTLSTNVSNHISDLNNPHVTTAAQVGNTTAQWNASALVGNQVSGTPTTNQALVYDSAKWIPSTIIFPTASGQANTASNLGIGPGLFSQKIGDDLQFRTFSGVNIFVSALNASTLLVSAQTSAALTAAITSLNGQTGAAQTITVGTGLDIAQGTNTFVITAANTTAIWNASALVGNQVSGTPTTNQVLTFDSVKWIPSTITFPTASGQANTASNLGVGSAINSASSFSQKVGDDLQFRIISGINLVVSNVNASTIIVSAQTSAAITSITGASGITVTAGLTPTIGASYTSAIWNASAFDGLDISGTPTTGQVYAYDGSAWKTSTITFPTASGQANTASNLGTGPGSSFSQKVGDDLQFRTISGINIFVSSVGTDTLLVSAQTSAALTAAITSLNSQTGAAQTITVASGLTLVQGTNTFDLRANYTSAIWNASSLSGIQVSGTPTIQQVLTYDGSKWVPSAAPGAGGGETNTASNLGTGPGSSFSQKVGVDLQFRTISGINIFVSSVGTNTLLVSAQTSAGVVGPANSTNTGVVLWDGTTGKLVKDSTLLVDSTYNITGASSIQLSSVIFGPSSVTPASSAGLAKIYLKNDTLWVKTPQGLVDNNFGGLNSTTLERPIGRTHMGYRNYQNFFSDFISSAGDFGITFSGTGAGLTNTKTKYDASHITIQAVGTGTVGTGAVWVGGTTSSMFLGSGAVVFETELAIVTIPTGAQAFTVRIGFGSTFAATSLNTCQFINSATDSAGTWIAQNFNAAVQTSANTSSVLDTNWHNYRIEINAAGTSSLFYIDGVLKATIAGLPTGSGKALAPRVEINKAVGTTSRVIEIDYMLCELWPTQARAFY